MDPEAVSHRDRGHVKREICLHWIQYLPPPPFRGLNLQHPCKDFGPWGVVRVKTQPKEGILWMLSVLCLLLVTGSPGDSMVGVGCGDSRSWFFLWSSWEEVVVAQR